MRANRLPGLESEVRRLEPFTTPPNTRIRLAALRALARLSPDPH